VIADLLVQVDLVVEDLEEFQHLQKDLETLLQ
jgi:hypothetical protein